MLIRSPRSGVRRRSDKIKIILRDQGIALVYTFLLSLSPSLSLSFFLCSASKTFEKVALTSSVRLAMVTGPLRTQGRLSPFRSSAALAHDVKQNGFCVIMAVEGEG